jgi:hypothetical protein
MESINRPTKKAFALLVFALVFISAWQFWTSLLDGQVFDYDLMAPIAYGFSALAGALTLFKLSRSAQQKNWAMRWLPVLGAVILLVAPFEFFFLRSPLIQKMAQIKYWAYCVGIMVVMIYLIISQRFTPLQRAGMIFSTGIGAVSPVMPWVGLLVFSPTSPLGNFAWPISFYGLWLTALVWAGTAWLMAREQIQGMKLHLTTILLLGLALFLAGIFNPMQFSSQTYQYFSYLGGTLVNQGFVDFANLNFILLAGMGLILFSLLLMFIQKKS